MDGKPRMGFLSLRAKLEQGVGWNVEFLLFAGSAEIKVGTVCALETNFLLGDGGIATVAADRWCEDLGSGECGNLGHIDGARESIMRRNEESWGQEEGSGLLLLRSGRNDDLGWFGGRHFGTLLAHFVETVLDASAPKLVSLGLAEFRSFFDHAIDLGKLGSQSLLSFFKILAAAVEMTTVAVGKFFIRR